jgi:hypothetical protein
MSYESIIEPLSYLSVLIEQKEEEESDDFEFDQINQEIAKVIQSQSEFSRPGCKILNFICFLNC